MGSSVSESFYGLALIYRLKKADTSQLFSFVPEYEDRITVVFISENNVINNSSDRFLHHLSMRLSCSIFST